MQQFLTTEFAYGFYTGCALLLIALYHHFRLKLEHGRYKRMLSDKLEIEANSMSKLKQELEAARKETENLRIKVQTQSENGDSKNVRDLEVYARAEKKMMMAAPGFAGPWEQAKQAAYGELAEEDTGKVAPKRFFQRFFGGNNANNGETVKALPHNETSKEREEAVQH